MSNYIEKISETRFFFSDDDIFKLQSSVLDREISDNTWLQPHAVPTLARNLHTTNKRIIKAINELHGRLNTLNTSLDSMSETYDYIIGDVSMSSLKNDFDKVSENILTSLIDKHKKIYGDDLDNPAALSEFSPPTISIIDALNQLKQDIVLIENAQNKVYEWTENTSYYQYQLVSYNNRLFICKNVIENSLVNPIDDTINWYPIAGGSGSSEQIVTKFEQFTLDIDDINNKYIILTETPLDNNIKLHVGCYHINNIDYTSILEEKKIIWGGYTLENDLEIGDILYISYNYLKSA